MTKQLNSKKILFRVYFYNYLQKFEKILKMHKRKGNKQILVKPANYTKKVKKNLFLNLVLYKKLFFIYSKSKALKGGFSLYKYNFIKFLRTFYYVQLKNDIFKVNSYKLYLTFTKNNFIFTLANYDNSKIFFTISLGIFKYKNAGKKGFLKNFNLLYNEQLILFLKYFLYKYKITNLHIIIKSLMLKYKHRKQLIKNLNFFAKYTKSISQRLLLPHGGNKVKKARRL